MGGGNVGEVSVGEGIGEGDGVVVREGGSSSGRIVVEMGCRDGWLWYGEELVVEDVGRVGNGVWR